MTDSPTPSDDYPLKTSFYKRVEGYRPSKLDINNLVLNYLINEGYPLAAEKFSVEANIPVNLRDSTLGPRVGIRNAILGGNVEDAILKINENFPTILDTDDKLHFSLLRLQLIELVRNGDMTKKEDIMAAIDFAAQQLAPRASMDPSFADALNYGMCLVVFNHDKLQPDIRKLLDTNLRREIAEQVNDAILCSQKEPSEVQIRHLMQVRQWAEQKCREMCKKIPSRIPLGLSPDDMSEGAAEEMNGNGDIDAMVQ